MRLLLSVILIVGLALTQADAFQAPGPGGTPAYQPAVPAPSTVNQYGGWGGSTGGGTVAGNAMQGMASAISAAGDYNLSTSAAAINMTQAQRNEIENRQMATNAYFDMRATNKAARAAEAGPKPTMEQLVRIAKEGAPRALPTGQLDPVTGKLQWPGLLQGSSFEPQRVEVDQIFAKRAVQGGLAYSDQAKAREAIDAMFAGLKGQIRNVPPPDYVASRGFLQSLKFAATKSELE
jgi:hypothetical protein